MKSPLVKSLMKTTTPKKKNLNFMNLKNLD